MMMMMKNSKYWSHPLGNGCDKNRITVSFIPYHISQNFEIRIENGKLNIYTKKGISVDSLNTLKLDIELLIGFSGQINNLSL